MYHTCRLGQTAFSTISPTLKHVVLGQSGVAIDVSSWTQSSPWTNFSPWLVNTANLTATDGSDKIESARTGRWSKCKTVEHNSFHFIFHPLLDQAAPCRCPQRVSWKVVLGLVRQSPSVSTDWSPHSGHRSTCASIKYPWKKFGWN